MNLFTDYSEGIAEFFDNSLQACSTPLVKSCDDYFSQNINLTLYLSKRLQCGYAVIYDNGQGMDTQDIQNFASYALNEAKRQNNSDFNEPTVHISKYGVGAKEAAFYLGIIIVAI